MVEGFIEDREVSLVTGESKGRVWRKLQSDLWALAIFSMGLGDARFPK